MNFDDILLKIRMKKHDVSRHGYSYFVPHTLHY